MFDKWLDFWLSKSIVMLFGLNKGYPLMVNISNLSESGC